MVVQGLIERIEKSLPDLIEGLNRFEIELRNIAPLNWLGLQNSPDKIYFSDRDKSFEVAATGSAKTITEHNSKNLKDALSAIENSLASSDSAIKYFGGICFDQDDEQSGGWESFGKYRFTVPEFELRTEDNKATFAYNIEITDKQNIFSVIEDFKKAVDSINFDNCNSSSIDKYIITNQTDIPNEKQWNENVTQVLNDLGNHRIQKVVLARKSKLQTSTPASPVEILKRLKGNNTNTYDFCFQMDNESAFVGCTPECLFKTQNKNIYSEALAGTRLKGTDVAEQKKYHKQLLESKKEQLEHDYVFQDVNESLNKVCSEVEMAGEREVVSLSYLQHFRTGFKGQLKDAVTISDIIKALHPTAAVNGYPSAAAKNEICKYEQFSRGWFAGPIGWVGKDSAHFAVAIRSAFIQGKEISLFAGAGIVESSEPACEWQETENKIKQFLDVI